MASRLVKGSSGASTRRGGDITSIDLGPRHARIVRKDGRTCAIDFADLQNADDVRAVLARAQDLLAQTAPRANGQPANIGAPPRKMWSEATRQGARTEDRLPSSRFGIRRN